MNYSKISYFDTANGPGIRVTLFVSGCSHKCKGCQNPDTWNPQAGELFTEAELNHIQEHLSKPYIKGITLSGGDPLYGNNLEEVLRITKEIKEKHPDKSVWLYTGYKWEDVKLLELLNYVDVLVDGEFIEEQKDISLSYCGSRNQRVIDVQKSLSTNKIILWETFE